MRDDEGLDERDKKLLDHVERYGWHVLLIQDGDSLPQFAYSVGMWHTLRHPEVCVIGLPPEVEHQIISYVGDRAKGGVPVPIDQPIHDVIDGYAVIFRRVGRKHYRDYFGYGIWFYRSQDFPVLQCVWPDRDGRWPWDAGFANGATSLQPVLTE